MIQRIPFIISLVLLFIISCTPDDSALVKLKIKNSFGETATLSLMRLTGNRELEVNKMSRLGTARFKIPMHYEGYYQLHFDNGVSMVLVLAPGDRVSISADMDSYHETREILGSPLTQRVASLHDTLRIRKKELNAIELAYSSADTLSEIYSNQRDSLAQEYLNVRNAHRKFTQIFILEDLKSLANIAALYQEFDENQYVLNTAHDIQFFKLVSDTLSKYYPRVVYVKNLKNNYTALFSEYQRSRLMKMATPIEEDIPNLILPGVGNRKKILSSLKGKSVLISFWSIRNPESRKNIVELQKVYKKYAPKGFEIYQVSIDKSIAEWEKAIAFEEIPWVSVIDTAFPNSRTQMFYNVNSIPMNYLVNAEQTEIIAKNVSPEMLDKVLPEVLKRN